MLTVEMNLPLLSGDHPQTSERIQDRAQDLHTMFLYQILGRYISYQEKKECLPQYKEASYLLIIHF